MNGLAWASLRPWEGSQPKAFEKLCCQLARAEPVPAGSVFVPKGDPDAGVECYFSLPDDIEWGWQAKFWLGPVGDTQFRELEESLKRAVTRHPKLTRYYVCVPRDREDPRDPKRQSLMDRWNAWAAKWETELQTQNRRIDLVYWGTDEILDRLARREHEGRHLFWFSTDLFGLDWFRTQLDRVCKQVGQRYSPEVHVDVPVASALASLGKTGPFRDECRAWARRLYPYCSGQSSEATAPWAQGAAQARAAAKGAADLFASVETCDPEPVPTDDLARLCRQGSEAAYGVLRALPDASPNGPPQGRSEDTVPTSEYAFRRLASEFRDLESWLSSEAVRAANERVLVVTGEAGAGKTHLLCDVARKRLACGRPSLLLLGEWFDGNEDPRSRVLQRLDVHSSASEMLGALNAAGEAYGTRLLVMLDALNEARPADYWRRELPAFAHDVARCPWLALAVTVRDDYREYCLSEECGAQFPEVVHTGFSEVEFEAQLRYFEHYGLDVPSAPPLSPESASPLFLKLYCQGLAGLGLTRVPAGGEGLTRMFNRFLEAVNTKLAQPSLLSFDAKLRPVPEAARALASEMARRSIAWLPRDEAVRIADGFLPGRPWDTSLYRSLVSEGVLRESVPLWGRETTEWVSFTHQLMGDVLIADALLQASAVDGSGSPLLSPSADSPLARCFQGVHRSPGHAGLLKALAILLPERYGIELADVLPEPDGGHQVREATLASIPWRARAAFSDRTSEYLHESFLGDTASARWCEEAYECLVICSAMPDHPYNAHFLHRVLCDMAMPERDGSWSKWCHSPSFRHSSVQRLIRWAWRQEPLACTEDDVALLAATALGWVLTTSNRAVRDSATKALVCLVTRRLRLLGPLLSAFSEVDDLYVVERLYAVAYGCAMRSPGDEGLLSLAQSVYERVFASGSPPPHILLRDYARGIVEFALHRGLPVSVDLSRLRPPYQTAWDDAVPSLKELEAAFCDGTPGHAGRRVYWSVVHEDFGLYIIGTNSGDGDWLDWRLGDARPATPRERADALIDRAGPELRERLDSLAEKLRAAERLRVASFGGEPDATRLRAELEAVLSRLTDATRASLDADQLREFDEAVLPCLELPDWQGHDRVPELPLSTVQRWVLRRVLALSGGMEACQHGEPEFRPDPSRFAHREERLGKKYQWMAYHECLARLADNFVLGALPPGSGTVPYDGPWQLHGGVRDIDPSCVVPRKPDGLASPGAACWWDVRYSAWPTDDLEEWAKRSDDLPEWPQAIEASDQDGRRWLALWCYRRWKQDEPVAEDVPRCYVQWTVSGYIVKGGKGAALCRSLVDPSSTMGTNLDLPESIRVLVGEYPWASAFSYEDTPYHGRPGWVPVAVDDEPVEVMVAADSLLREAGTHDYSVDATFRVLVPCAHMAEGMGLSWNGREGELVDAAGRVVAQDPSVLVPGSDAVFVDRDALVAFLTDNGYDLVWVVWADKVVSRQWLGRANVPWVEVRGAYRLVDDRVEGEAQSHVLLPGQLRRKARAGAAPRTPAEDAGL